MASGGCDRRNDARKASVGSACKTIYEVFLGLAVVGAVYWGGCKPASPVKAPAPDVPPPGTQFRLVVVGDPELASAIEVLRGEWNAQSGWDFSVKTLDESAEPKTLEAIWTLADAAVLPVGWLPSVATGDPEAPPLAEVPANLREAEGGPWGRIFGTLRVRELTWGNRAVAVPFGSPVFVLYCREDWLEKLGEKPPQTWDAYQRLVQRLAAARQQAETNLSAGGAASDWVPALEPLAAGWAGRLLLARTAAYVAHREHFSTFFDIETMEALVDRPPFVRALQELCAAVRGAESTVLTLDPDGVRKAFWEGRCALAITWPTASAEIQLQETPPEVVFAELPGSRDVFDPRKAQWQKRRADEPIQVPLLGVSGRLGVVSQSTRWPAAVFQLLFWLSADRSWEVSSKSRTTTLYRDDHLQDPLRWVEPLLSPQAALQYAELTRETLDKTVAIVAVPLPGHNEYLSILDDAVRRAVKGELSAEAALREAAEGWNELTERSGRDRQRQAYWQSLGLE